jgi:HAD superfamily hydrolase (TIGR01509 family)
MRRFPITCLFVDIGGVLLTNGWDHLERKRAATYFKLPWAEMDRRHRLMFETHEEGRLSIDDYLKHVVFYENRPFTREQFKRFMRAQSNPFPAMIDLIAQLKVRYKLKVFVVSNESRYLNAHRIQAFGLNHIVDCFISSCFVGLRKPDPEIFRLALDVAQAPLREIIYIENTPMFVQIAEGLGIRSILHTNFKSTCAKLTAFGLPRETR